MVSASERSFSQELHAYSCFSSAISASSFCHAAGKAGIVLRVLLCHASAEPPGHNIHG